MHILYYVIPPISGKCWGTAGGDWAYHSSEPQALGGAKEFSPAEGGKRRDDQGQEVDLGSQRKIIWTYIYI